MPRRPRTCRRRSPPSTTTATAPSPSGRRRACASATHFSAQLFHRGFLQRKRVALYLQPRSGPARPVAYESRLFDLGTRLAGQSFAPDLGFAGFRLHTPSRTRRPGARRGSRRSSWCSSARPISACGRPTRNTGSRRGVSPSARDRRRARSFPTSSPTGSASRSPEARTLTVLSLLDSPSVAGAYRFASPRGPGPDRRHRRAPSAPGDREARARAAHQHVPVRRERARRPGRQAVRRLPAAGARFRRALRRGRGRSRSCRPDLAAPGQRAPAAADLGLRGPAARGVRAAAAGAGVLPPTSTSRRARRRGPACGSAPDPAGGAFAEGAVQLFEIPSGEEYMDNIVAAFVPAAPRSPAARCGSPTA